jgi:hypothetical protein
VAGLPLKKKKGVTRVAPDEDLDGEGAGQQGGAVVIRPEMSPHASAVLFVSLVAET